MFSHLRSYYVISFVVVLLAAFAVGIYFRTGAANGLIKHSETKNAVIVSRSFANNIWSKYRQTINELAGKDKSEWANNTDFIQFYQEGRMFFTDVPLVKFSIYSVKHEPIFSISRTKVYDTGGWIQKLSPLYYIFYENEEEAFTRATKGEVVSRFIPHGEMIEGKLSNTSVSTHVSPNIVEGSFIQIYVPIFAANAGDGDASKVEAVAEVYYNISNAWEYLFRFQLVGTLGIITFATVLYVTLVFVSQRAEKIISKQHEANIELTTAKTRAEAESQEKSKFLANVSHELRTPLNAIIGFSQIMKDEVNGPLGNDQYKDYIRDINSSGSHLLSLINDILDYSKAEANKLDMEEMDVDLNKTIKSSIRFVMPRAEEAKVELVEKTPKEHIILRADSKRLKQILLNLLSNAVKFTPEGGKVTLTARINPDGSLTIEVTDTGIGIAQQDISKAMATFGQVDSKLSRRYEGTGLGLPLTKRLTELMGGAFEIKSEVGLGTTITLTFKKEKLSSLPVTEG